MRGVRRVERDDDGSIIITMLVALVASGLIMALILLTDAGIRQSDRAGDSANALQLADAGVNEAVKRAATEPTAVTTFTDTKTLAGAGSYTFTATRDAARPSFWHVVANGQDATGERRRIRADAVPEPLFVNALFGQASITLDSGVSVDSYKSPTEQCTGQGLVGTNTAGSFTQIGSGGGGGVTNCQHDPANGSGYPYDGCISYADSSPPDFLPAANCPPGNIVKRTPRYQPREWQAPSGTTFVAQPAAYCRSNNGTIPSGTYYWTGVLLTRGCIIDGNVVIYTTGAVQLGQASGGANQMMNAPIGCSNAPTDDACFTAGQAAKLQIRAVHGSSGSYCFYGSNTKIWGAFEGSTREFSKCGGGGSHLHVFGAMSFNDVNSNAQFSLHFDESLFDLTSGKYVVGNWREQST